MFMNFELFKTNVRNLTKLFLLQTLNLSEKLKCNMEFCKVAVTQFGKRLLKTVLKFNFKIYTVVF